MTKADDEDEILRKINEEQEWSEIQSTFQDGSSSQTDTLHKRPQALKILQQIEQSTRPKSG